MIWEWVGLGLTYFLTRQLPRSGRQTRVLVAIMIGLAVAVAILGLYQVAVTLPAERAAYAANPEEVLRELGQWYEPGSPERMRFEARLASTEPLATFALTNSLAGLLVAWIIVHAGVLWQMLREQRDSSLAGLRLIRFGSALAALAVMLICLALTKSRSAYVALGIGTLVLPLTITSITKAVWKWIAIGGGLVAALVAVVIASDIGRSLVSGAVRSFQFRLEYWQATLDLIANFPIFGVGPGEFQDYYTMYKLPQASEEIRDPHNFILEVWATGGTLALAGLVATLAGFGMAWHESRTSTPAALDPAAQQENPWLPLLGALAGLPLAYAAGLPFGFMFTLAQALIAAGAGAVLVFAIWPWVSEGTVPRSLPAVGALVLMVHWLASGGFTFPGVAGSFWILVALTVNQAVSSESGQADQVSKLSARWSRWLAVGATVATLAALVACYLTALLPVMTVRATLVKAANQQLNPETRIELILAAGAADWASDEPFMAMAELSVEQIRKDPTSTEWPQNLVKAARGLMLLHGHSSAIARRLAGMFREVHAMTGSSGAADRCVDMARIAAMMYPNSALLQAEYALALDIVANQKAARRVAQRALELDSLTPHLDKKLPADLKQRMRELAVDQDS
jgi:hypothetical protein